MWPDGWQDVRRILIVRPDNIGDIIMLGPALRSLRHALPQAAITLLASPAGTQAAPLLPWLDDVITVRALWQDVSGALPFDPDREQALVRSLHDCRFDAAVIFTSFAQSPYPPAYLCYLAGIPIRLGQSKEFGGALLTQWTRPLPDEVHQVDRNLHLLEAAGFPPAGRHLELCIPPAAQASADELLAVAGIAPDRPFVLLAPGASAAARRYDPLRFAAAAEALAQRAGLAVVVAGSARDAELAAPILAASPAFRSLIGRTSVPELAGVIRRAALLLANDSGPMHLADALGRPMVILFAGTEHESQWRPRGAANVLLRRPTPCSPCYAFTCPYQMECLDIPASEVVERAVQMLAETGPAATAAGGQSQRQGEPLCHLYES